MNERVKERIKLQTEFFKFLVIILLATISGCISLGSRFKELNFLELVCFFGGVIIIFGAITAITLLIRKLFSDIKIL